MAPSAILVESPLTDTVLSPKKGAGVQNNIVTTHSLDEKPKIPSTIDELIRQRALEAGDDCILSYPSSALNYVDFTFRQLDVFASRAARIYQSKIPQRSSSSDSEVVVGLLGPSNLEYLISVLALSKLGHTVLFLSTRISTAAYSSLLKSTGAHHIVLNESFRKIIQQVEETVPYLQIHNMLGREKFEFPIARDDVHETRFDRRFNPEVEASKISWIIHSSGSTGLPKPIFQTHRAALNNYTSNMNLRGFITLPLYHAHGISSLFRSIQSMKQIYLYNADLPLTLQHLVTIFNRYDFEIFYGVPYALKLLGETKDGIAALASMKVVMFGGSACPDALGNRLVESGVNLISHYGTTETGQLMTSARGADDKAWDYVRVGAVLKPFIRFEERSPETFELVALEGLPSKVASNRPDGSYATKDLFTPHKSIPDAWKYLARLDDTIVLMNGEKVVPIAFEQSVRDNNYVTDAVLFGSGKARVGMIIIASPATQSIPTQEIERLLVPVLAEANKLMPAYAQLSLEMVKILPYDTPYPRTDKGTVIRTAFYRAFAVQIEEIYEKADISSGELSLSEPELIQYLRIEMSKILSPSTFQLLQDDTDFFSIGVDSLQAIQLRSVLGKNIRTGGRKLSSNIVFDFPNMKLLAAELYRLRTGGELNETSITRQMEDLITKYSNFEEHAPVSNLKDGKYIVVTGVTGSLGAHIVSQLASKSDVKKIYCLVRAQTSIQARLRVVRSLRERALYHLLLLVARNKLVAVPSDFSKKDLGLEPSMYNTISSEMTDLIHCAWSVNFNLALGSFENDCIAGTHNLINLCLKAKQSEPATFNFCSSVSSVAATKGGFVPEALPESLEYAQNMGYAQSKLVTEHICVVAAKDYGTKTRVLRVGQVVADTVHGIWNATEAIPLMMQAGLTIGAIPTLDESPLWLPVDVVASTICDISLSKAPAGVMNVVNHQCFHWTKDLIPALHRAGLNFSEVGQQEWIALLRKSNPDPVANPPIKLLEFFAGKYDSDRPRNSLTYGTSYTRFLSPSLAAALVLNQQLVDKFVRYFNSTSWKKLTPMSKTIIFIAGPCGAGKSTIATAISKSMNTPWIEGDSLHSAASIAKMSAGTPLSDDDRWIWLESIKATALLQMQSENLDSIIVTCSALKKVYREELRKSRVMRTVFIMLEGDRDILVKRIKQREGHYMGADMVQSQLENMEPLGVEETDAVPVDVSAEKGLVVEEVLSILGDIFQNT